MVNQFPIRLITRIMKNYDIYLFDFDGTIVDSYESMVYIFMNALERCGLKGDINEVLQYSRQPISKTFLDKGGNPENMKEFFDITIGLLNEDINLTMNKLFDDTLSSLEVLKARGHKIAIVTSNSNERVREILNYLGVNLDFFDAVVGFESTDTHKPEAGPILKALELLNANIETDKAVYVGDALDDMLSAKNANIDYLLLERHNEYKEYKDHKISSLMELIND